MLYLEDYLEMIEHLPQELRDRFTEIREMDLQVHNAMDNLEEEVKTFFAQAKRTRPEIREMEYNKIRGEYIKTLEDAEEKVNIANQMYELVERYLRRLDQELEKFKNELEQDSPGITEVLERRSHELDVAHHNHHHHHSSSLHHNQQSHNSHHPISSQHNSNNQVRKKYSTSGHHIREGGLAFRDNLSSNGGFGLSSSNPTAPLTLYNANNAIAAAASQAIAATNQLSSGRRTASLKASLDAIAGGPFSPFDGLGIDSSSAGQKNNKRIRSSSQFNEVSSDSSDATLGGRSGLFDNGEAATPLAGWTPDPDEPTYCICNQVSYGEMIACDNVDCDIEWFHYNCVGLTAAPKGKWYCPNCTAKMKKRRVLERP